MKFVVMIGGSCSSEDMSLNVEAYSVDDESNPNLVKFLDKSRRTIAAFQVNQLICFYEDGVVTAG